MNVLKRGAVVASAVALIAVAGCSGATPPGPGSATSTGGVPQISEDLLKRAQQEGSLTLYSSVPAPQRERDAARFEQLYGVKVNMPITFTGTGNLVARLQGEIDSGSVQADVMMMGDAARAQVWASQGAFAPLPKVGFPEATDFYSFTQVQAQGMSYNTSQVSEADVPKTFKDLLDPKWKGKIALGRPEISANYNATYYALLKDPNYGEAYFQQLAANKPVLINSLALLANTVASGAVPIGIVNPEPDVINLKATSPGAPIAWRPLDVAEQIRNPTAIMAKAPHPAAGELFITWLMSQDGQATHNGSGGGSSLLGNLPGTLQLPPAGSHHDISWADLATDQDDIIAMFNRLFG